MFYWDIIWGSNLEFGLVKGGRVKATCARTIFLKNIGDERFFKIVNKMSEIEKG